MMPGATRHGQLRMQDALQQQGGWPSPFTEFFTIVADGPAGALAAFTVRALPVPSSKRTCGRNLGRQNG
jgi:hypothetical protein